VKFLYIMIHNKDRHIIFIVMKFSMTFHSLHKIPWLSRPGKLKTKIPWLSRFSRTHTNPVLYEIDSYKLLADHRLYRHHLVMINTLLWHDNRIINFSLSYIKNGNFEDYIQNVSRLTSINNEAKFIIIPFRSVSRVFRLQAK